MIKAVLTGHSRGLGAAIAESLLVRGIPVLAIARRHADLASRFPQLLREVALDLSDPTALIEWLEEGALESFMRDAGKALLVNNAGALQPIAPLGSQDAQAIERTVTLNVTAPLMLANAFVAATAGCVERRVLHVSSGAGRKIYPGWSVYGATKAALDHHARVAAAEPVRGLRVSSLAPGVIDTEMQAEIRASSLERFPQRERFDALKSEGALAAPREAADRIVDYLLSDRFAETPDPDLRNLPAPADAR